MVKILLGTNNFGEEIYYNYIPFESRGIAINAVTRSGKSTLIFEIKRKLKSCGLDVQLVSIARDKVELLQRDEIDFILVGNGGEIPMDVKFARQTGQQVRMMHLDCIVHINSLPTEKEQDEYISEFLIGLQMDHDEKFWEKPCGLFLDEVQIICNSGATKYVKSKDTIAILAQTSIKKNIIPIVASHKMKDFYSNARDEITNHIVGYIDNPAQRKFACELLNLDPSASETIRSFQNAKGTFYFEGADIHSPATIVKIKANKFYENGRIIVPKLTLQGLQKAKALLHSLDLKEQMSKETALQFEVANLRTDNDTLSQNQMDDYTRNHIFDQGKKAGIREEHDRCLNIINHIKDETETKLFYRGPKVIVVTRVIHDSGLEMMEVKEK